MNGTMAAGTDDSTSVFKALVLCAQAARQGSVAMPDIGLGSPAAVGTKADLHVRPGQLCC